MRGRDKLLEIVEGRALIRRQVEIAKAATTGRIFVTLPKGADRRENALSGCDVHIVPVPHAASGMSASLRSGLQALPSDATAVMVLLADLPDLTSQDLADVLAAVDLNSETLIWRGATSAGAPGHPIVFAQPLFHALGQLTGDSGGAEVVAQHSDHMVLIPLPGQRARRDLDTPEDWASWRAGRND